MIHTVSHWLWRRRVKRAWQLVEAKRFMKYATIPPQLPSALVVLPDRVKMKDVVFWYQLDDVDQRIRACDAASANISKYLRERRPN